MTKKTFALLLAVLLLAACDKGSPSASPSASAGNRQQLLALGQEWVKCLRDHGLTRMPDVELSQEGYIEFPASGYNWKEDLRKHKDIIDACQPIEDRYPPNAFRPKQQFSADDLKKLAAYAACVREQGVPDFPDPDETGNFDVTGTSVENGMPGKLREKIDAACRTIWSGDVRITGGGSGGKK
jgi:hypothetical protein